MLYQENMFIENEVIYSRSLFSFSCVTDADVMRLADNLSCLEQLDLLGTNNITDVSIERFEIEKRFLQSIASHSSIEWAENMFWFLCRLLQKCSSLRFLDLSFCGKLSVEGIRSFRENYPHVDIKRSYQEREENSDSE